MGFLYLKGGEKNFFEKIQIWFVQIEKISQLVSEGENLTNLENRIDIQQVHTVEGNSGDSCRVNQYRVGYYEILGYGVPSY